MQVGCMVQKALGELFILKSTKPLPIIFKGVYNSSEKPYHRAMRVTCHKSSHSVSNPTQVNTPQLSELVLDLPIPEGWKAELT